MNAKEFTVINNQTPLNDSSIIAKVKGALIKTNIQGIDVSSLNTHVETKDGVIYLSGAVNNQLQIANAVKIAKSVDGANKVKSSLKLKNLVLRV